MQCLLKRCRQQERTLSMTAEVYLNREQEEKFFAIYEHQGFTGTNEELVQQLFNEALTANYLLAHGKIGKQESKQERLLSITFDAGTEDEPTAEEIAEIMQELYEQENE